MAIEAAQSRNVRILAVVLNEMEDLPEEDAEANVWWIEQRYPDVPVLRSDSDGAAPQLLELLVREISGSALM
jgi:dethiobiotin synthetase